MKENKIMRMTREMKGNFIDGLTTRQLAPLLAVSSVTIIQWCNAGKIKCAKTIGGHRRIPVSEYIRIAQVMGIEPINIENCPQNEDKPTPPHDRLIKEGRQPSKSNGTKYPINRYIKKTK